MYLAAQNNVHMGALLELLDFWTARGGELVDYRRFFARVSYARPRVYTPAYVRGEEIWCDFGFKQTAA